MKFISAIIKKEYEKEYRKEQQEKQNAIWNMLASILNSAQTVILLFIVTRILGVIEGGIFSFAFSTADMLLHVGTYGVRNYQVTDILKKHSFHEYHALRIVTSTVMIILSIFLSFCSGYSIEKSFIIFTLCLFKCLEGIEDLFFGEYQLEGRLDIAGKLWFLRLAANIGIFFVLIYNTKNMLYACGGMVFLSFLFIVGNRTYIQDKFQQKEKQEISISSIKTILWNATPIFLYSFLSIYICNVPKYAIDRILSEKYQAYYGVLFMPIFVINLLSGFIYRPILVELAREWNQKERKKFFKKIYQQCIFIVIVTTLLCLFAIKIELPILSWIYQMELVPYGKEYLILLIGGGCNAVSYFITACITVQRNQSKIMYIIIGISLIGTVCSDTLVRNYEILGASMLYSGLMILQMIILFMICQCYRKEK